MSVDPSLLARYLRQLGELGGGSLFLDSLDAEEALRLLAEPRAPARTPFAAEDAESAREPSGEPHDRGGVPALPAAEANASASFASSAAPSSAGAAAALRVLGQEVAGCTRCALSEGRRSVVFGEGDPAARVVVVGEAPGAEEDRTGRPFVGPAGKLLDRLLLTAGFAREQVFICNVLKCRPPNNRNPEPAEVASCSPYLRRQIELIGPRVLLAVGKFAAQTLTGTEESIGRLRGRIHDYHGTPVVVTYHPAYLLRSPRAVRTTWQDFQTVRQVLDE